MAQNNLPVLCNNYVYLNVYSNTILHFLVPFKVIVLLVIGETEKAANLFHLIS
jgi:hypothetical protein